MMQTLNRQFQWVGQDDAKGCVIACVAMIAGVSYQQAKEYFALTQPDAGEREIGTFEAIEYLRQHGWEQCGYRSFTYNREKQCVEMFSIDPMEGAEVTLCVVLPSQVLAHAVLMLSDGSVLDPARSDIATSLQSYPKVECLRGFRRI